MARAVLIAALRNQLKGGERPDGKDSAGDVVGACLKPAKTATVAVGTEISVCGDAVTEASNQEYVSDLYEDELVERAFAAWFMTARGRGFGLIFSSRNGSRIPRKVRKKLTATVVENNMKRRLYMSFSIGRSNLSEQANFGKNSYEFSEEGRSEEPMPEFACCCTSKVFLHVTCINMGGHAG